MAAHPTELEAEESEAAPSGQVDGPTLFLVDRDLQSGQFLPESSVNGLQQSVMPAVGVHQNHQIVSEAHILKVDVLALTRGVLRPLEHLVHLGEVEVTEHR